MSRPPRQAPTSAAHTVAEAEAEASLPPAEPLSAAAALADSGSTPTTLGAAAAARLDARISAFFLSLFSFFCFRCKRERRQGGKARCAFWL